MIRAVFVQNETLGAYKTEVTIFTGRSVSISESHLENVLWALFFVRYYERSMDKKNMAASLIALS